MEFRAFSGTWFSVGASSFFSLNMLNRMRKNMARHPSQKIKNIKYRVLKLLKI